MKLITLISTIVLSLSATLVQAGLYDQFATPNAIKCDALVKGVCTDASRPDKVVMQYRDRTTGALSMKEETTYELVYCRPRKDLCFDDMDNYRGKSVQTKDSRYVVFKDYYVYPAADGSDWAYKNGTGPLFGGALAANTPTPTIKATHKTFDVWCNPVGDNCVLNTKPIARARLKAHVPLADDTSNCSLEFCYNDNDDVIGLNPDYTFN